MKNAEKHSGNQWKERYTVIESVGMALVVCLFILTAVTEWCKVSIDGFLPVLWLIASGIAVVVWELPGNRAVSAAIVGYTAVMSGWILMKQEESGWQNGMLLLGCFLMILLCYRLQQFRVVRVMTGICVMELVIVGYFVGADFSKMVIALAIFLFLCAVSELIAFFYQGNTKFLVILYGMIALLTITVPISEEPYGWGFVHRIVDWSENVMKVIMTEIQYQFEEASESNSFSFQMTGYSDEEMNLFSRMMETDVEQLLLLGDYTRNNLYLKGKVCNEYTGTGWTVKDGATDIDYRMDALMTLYAIFEQTEDVTELNRFIELKEQKVTLKNIKTQSLFYPLKVISVSECDVIQQGEHLKSAQLNARGYSYSYYFFDIDYSNEQVIEMMKNCQDIVYEEEQYNRIYTNLKEIYHIEIEPIPFDIFCMMAKRAGEEAYKNSSNTGEFVSEKVEELAQTISKECEDSYEICKALEKYLHGYSYNKAVKVSLEENVLDTFLFEKKEGYCAHYATALATMLRCRAIPSRVAEGFLVNYKERTDIYEYAVNSNRAHVWTEAYLDGFGWIRLEPTTIYTADANKLWYHKTQMQDEENMEEVSLTQASELGIEDDYPEEESKKDEKSKSEKQLSYLFLTGIFVIGMAACVCMVVIGLRYYRKLIVYKSKDPDLVFMYMLAKIEKKYMAKEKGETLGEYIVRLNTESNMPKEDAKELWTIKCAMEGYWYGEKNVSATILDDMKQIINKKDRKRGTE